MTDSLISHDRVINHLMYDAPWSHSHGGGNGFLGFGMIYYAVVYALRATTVVCLGSGGGFVPRLMRQAQRDLGIADHSRTLLVDGNLPEAGWGSPNWLDPESFFRREFADVEILLETTADAVGLLIDEGLTIDYLHIDADHSFQGSLDDFQMYRPLLHPGSVITLHDTNFGGSGVRHLVNYLRTVPGLELVDFEDLGAGTALARIGSIPASFSPHMSVRFGDPGDAVYVERVADCGPPQPTQRDWNYLDTEVFRCRNHLAAAFVDDCPTIVEIGAYRSPIDLFLNGEHERVIVVDPLIREIELDELRGRPCKVSHVRARFQDLAWQIQRPQDYGLVMLGFELIGMDDQQFQTLFELVENARVTVIEFPSSWDISREQFDHIINHARVRERMRLNLDLSGNDLGDLGNSWPPRYGREIHVLEPSSA